MSKPTGHHDRDGIPIHVGDLIRTEHYTHRRGNRMMWLYFRVAEKRGNFVVQNWNDLDASKYQCLLKDCRLSYCQVVAESKSIDNWEPGTFNERTRIKK